MSNVSLPFNLMNKKAKWRHSFDIFLHIFPLILMPLFFGKTESVNHCEPHQFQCKNGNCVLGASICNGIMDCSDGSDEVDCGIKSCKSPHWYQCSDAHGLCVSAELLCNGYENCPKGEDELNCSSHSSNASTSEFHIGYGHSMQRNCTQSEFTCKTDKSCIPSSFMCDGKSDCFDNSDESLGCLESQNQCQTYFCDNKHCLESSKWICDGVDDCGDGSDERNCSKALSCLPEAGTFLCSDNVTCLPLQKACNGLSDCPDGSDESSQCLAAKNCSNSSCPPASKCHMLPQYGVKCVCPQGFRYSTSAQSVCVDINECEETFGICSQKCRNFPGKFECFCDNGYLLQADKLTCKARMEEKPILIYTTQVAVMGINLHSRRLYTIATNLTKVIGVTYDGKYVYWTNIHTGDESIVRANANGSEQVVLLTSGLEAPEDLAIDWLTGNIYFSDNFKHHIAVCSQDGHFCTALVTKEVHQPRALAVWPQKGQMFWSDWGYRPSIMRASMDGSNIVPLVNQSIYWPNGVTLDMHNDRVYWVDAKFATIDCIRTDGTDRRTILEDIPKHPYGLAIYEDRLYWSDWITRSIHLCNKFTGKDHRILVKDRTIYSVYIHHPSKQVKTSHACEHNSCSHLCLLAENNRSSCACPDGMQLADDRKLCKKYMKNDRFYIGVGSHLLEVEHTKFGGHNITATYNIHFFIHQIAYNTVNNTIFIADNLQHVISEYDMKVHAMKIWVKKNLGNVTDLAFDHFAHNLYWSDAERHVIEVISLQTGYRAVVSFYAGLEVPIGFVIVPENGVMFVALKNHIIARSLSNHRQSTHVFERDINAEEIKFVADMATHTLYWAESNRGEIFFTNYRQIDVLSFRKHLHRPYSISIVGSDLIWSELGSNTIYWTHKGNMAYLKHFDININDFMPSTRAQSPNMLVLGRQAPSVVDHPCQHWNDGCSHVCVTFTKSKGSCLCPAGMVFLNANNRTCIESVNCEFRCTSGECLMETQICDGRAHCPDGSDETLCNEKKKNHTKILCTMEEFRCHTGEQCIEAKKRCDHIKHCYDGSDEEHCDKFDKSHYCHFHQHKCNNGHCVDFSVLCDGFNDCGDNSDEIRCTLTGSTLDSKPDCNKNMFQCTSGTCIGKSWECDGKIDCADASDEHEKCAVRECPPEMHKCFLGQCIDKRLVCDGNSDCSDESDEMNCKTEGNQDSCFDKFVCPSNKTMCLELSAKCNNIAECPRGEDELNCDDACNLYEFQCKSSQKCIRREFVCDSDRDCEDGSDEENCIHDKSNQFSHEHMCGPNMYNCKNGFCVDLMRVCDGIQDCETGADEGPLCNTACLSLKNGKGLVCENKCNPTPIGAVCSCYKGYRLEADQRSCTDINECEEMVPCGQICENISGSYRCSCYPEFMLSTDKTTCKSIERENSILFATYNEVRSRTEMPITLKIVWSANDSKIKSFDVNSRTRNGYFSTDSEHILYQVNVTNGKIIMGLLVNQPSKVAVDWITDNVYVISVYQVYEIKVCSFKSKMCGTVVKSMPNQIIKALTVDAYNKKLFFAVLESQGSGEHKSRIATSNLDGAKRHYILTKENGFITALACDPYKRILYLIDRHQRSLQFISYAVTKLSSKPITIMEKTIAITRPSGMSWYENEAFIVNLGSKEAVRCQLFGVHHHCRTFDLNVLNAANILIDGISRQPMKRNPCTIAECRGMCVQSEHNYVCMCDDSIVSETKKCDSFNHVTSGSLLEVKPTTNVESNGIAASISILGIIILFIGIGCLYCRYRNKESSNVIDNLHFHNPLSVYFSNREKLNNNLNEKVNKNCCATISETLDKKCEDIHVDWRKQTILANPIAGEDRQIQLEAVKPVSCEIRDAIVSKPTLIPKIVIEDINIDEYGGDEPSAQLIS